MSADLHRRDRVRRLNSAPPRPDGAYVLYWMQAERRLGRNHALDEAVRLAEEAGRPLVVYEGLRLDYPWASRRLHRFVLEGMRDNAAEAEALGLNYWPFVATPRGTGRGLLRGLAARASVVVTDDTPGFQAPAQAQALAARTDVAVLGVDSRGVVPLAWLEPTPQAAHFRRRHARLRAEAWAARAAARPGLRAPVTRRVAAPFETWDPDTLESTLASLPLDPLAPVPGTPGGTRAGRARLRAFVTGRLRGYARRRSHPAAPEEAHASGLSPWLHFGHLSAQEVLEAALDAAGKDDPDVESFLDELLTWRDLAHAWVRARGGPPRRLAEALPSWAWRTLEEHARDARPHHYEREELEAGHTHDPLWNAAQRELVAAGAIHPYLRMLWGKKVIEWSPSPEAAWSHLVELNNRYALDGRDANSHAGILWCFGLFDRPWAPERPVFGRVRYMSSENTARKFRLRAYHEYVAGLPTIEEARRGRAAPGGASAPPGRPLVLGA